MGPARRIDSSAVLIVPNFSVRMGDQHSIPAQSFHDSVGEGFISFLHTVGYTYKRGVEGGCEFGVWPLIKNEFPLQMLGDMLRMIIATKREMSEGLRRPFIDALVICTPQCVLLGGRPVT